jgi:hypothetical protein
VRFALITPLLVAGALFACSTFSGTEDEQPTPPPVEAGEPDVVPPIDTCTPVVFDETAPSACAGKDLQNDFDNCGACGHRCGTTSCKAGLCEREQVIATAQPILAVSGKYAYAPLTPEGSVIGRADLTAPPPVTFASYFDNQSGTVNHLEVYGDDLYIGWSNNQTILKLDDDPLKRIPRPNDAWKAVNTDIVVGHFLPGATSYYLFPDKSAGVTIARIAPNAPVQFKQESSVDPIARSGDALYWTQKLGAGTAANLVGPWERADRPLAIVDATIEAFAAEGETAFVAGGEFLSRATRGLEVKRLARERGVGVAFAIEGDQLYYAVRRDVGGMERHLLFHIDRCKGGEPVPVMDINSPILGIYFTEPAKVLVNTTSGLFRMPR